MPVAIIESKPPTDADAIQVTIYPKPSDPTVILVDIVHIFQSGADSATFRYVLRAQPSNVTEALRAAKRYAEAHNLSQIHVDDLR